ncbi:MAG: CPBP family intramembrane glutamic endopeptidase [bacterium]
MRTFFAIMFVCLSVSAVAAPPPPPPPPPVSEPSVQPREDVPEVLSASDCGHPNKITCSLVILPIASLLLPGLGQYWDGQTGWPYTLAAAAGLGGATAAVANTEGALVITQPRAQLFLLGAQLWIDASLLSAYETYRHRVVDRVGFQDDLSTVPEVLIAPFDVRALARLRVLIPFLVIGAAGLGSAFVDEDGMTYESAPFEDFRVTDGLFAFGVSYGAGVGEEAFFRGYVMHGFDRVVGMHPLLANTLQASMFATAHADFSWGFLVRMAFGMYTGWLTQADDYNLRDAIFLHTWWDVFVFVGTVATSRRNGTATLSLPAIRF